VLFIQDDVEDFTEKIVALYNDPQKMKIIAQNAVQTTSARLNWDTTGQIIIGHYAQIASK